MVQPEAFRARLKALAGYLAALAELRSGDEAAFLADPARHHLAERYLHLAIEASLDLANHFIAERGLRAPVSNRDTFAVLAEVGQITAELCLRLQGWASFRNVLVHEYVAIDHAVSWRAIQRELGDLEALAAWAAGVLDADGSSPGGPSALGPT